MESIKVLVAGGDPASCARLGEAFAVEAPFFEVEFAPTGPQAVASAQSASFDAVVIDGSVGMDAYDLTAQVRATAGAAGAAVIVLADQPTEAGALRARQAGAAAHLSRMNDLSEVVSKVKALGGARNAVAGTVPVAAMPSEAASRAGLQSLDVASAAVVAAPRLAEVVPIGGAPGLSIERDPGIGVTERIRTIAPGDARSAVDVPHVDDLLRLMIERNASDLHITVGSPPGLRLRGEITPLEEMRSLTTKDTQTMLMSILSEEQRRRFENELELDFAYSLPGVSRFRANIFQQRNSMGAVFRMIPLRIPTIEELHLPKVCAQLAERPRGLVLVTGPTGSGKSTTLAAMVDHINETRKVHIITLEDPIEFMHHNKLAYVNQREIGEDTHSFGDALKRVLRQDPDVILVGEMRDLETISAAITAAETGHLVLATLHTTGGPETVDRIIDVFPPYQQTQVRTQLSATLEGVISQVLLRSTDGRSRVMAMEIMLGVPAISNLIREGKTHQMATIIQGGGRLGMQTLDQSLRVLLSAGKITWDEAMSKSKSPRELAQMLGRKI